MFPSFFQSQYVLIHDCFMKMLEAKRLSEMKTYSDDNLYANEGFGKKLVLSCYIILPQNECFQGGILESACLSIHPCLHLGDKLLGLGLG